MRNIIILLVFLGAATWVRGDEAVANAQQTLKDQGFYYGEITGEKDADTTAAIRRYQIRSGLQVTGDLNDETLRSLRSNPAPSPPAATMTPAPAPDTSDLRDDSSQGATTETPAPARPVTPPQDRQIYPSNPAIAPSRTANLFAGTPYEASSPDVQTSVIVAVQQALAARELYRGNITGLYGPTLEFSLRAYQSRVGLAVSGRPDLETLAALELLPGASTPVYRPRKWWQRPRRLIEPPVRGEWIRP